MKWVGLLLGGVAVALVVSNWKACGADYYNVDATGHRIPDTSNVPLGTDLSAMYPRPWTTHTGTRTPDWQCLINPFPGGL